MVTLVPLVVFTFLVLYFQLTINDSVLDRWIAQFPFPHTVVVLGLRIDAYAVLRIKAAALLATLSAGSTVATLLTDKDRTERFVVDAFARDVHRDRCLMALDRILRSLVGTARSAPQYSKPAAAPEPACNAWIHSPTSGTVILFGEFKVNAGGVPGVPMVATLNYKTKTTHCYATTDASGIASCKQRIGQATRGYRVKIDVVFFHDGSFSTTVTGFKPEQH